MTVAVEQCPLCGAPAALSEKQCSYCGAEFFVSSLAYLSGCDATGIHKYIKQYQTALSQTPNSLESLVGLALCYLTLGLFPNAVRNLERAIDAAPETPRLYYYLAMARVGARRIKALPLKEIREIETLLGTALQLGGDYPEVKVFLAMIKRDYYDANGLKVPPPGAESLLSEIRGSQINRSEFERLIAAALVSDAALYSKGLQVV